jgi:hypothetical protein
MSSAFPPRPNSDANLWVFHIYNSILTILQSFFPAINYFCIYTFPSLLLFEKGTVMSRHCDLYGFPNVLMSIHFQNHDLKVIELCLLNKHSKIKIWSSPPHRGHYLICIITRCFILTLSFLSFTALSIHFESQCIPTSLSWYAHHLPLWFLKLVTVVTFVVEIGLPALFFSPVRSVRIVTFFIQVCNIFKCIFVKYLL